jgi:predicted O-methyltransferase YrrM
MTTSNVAWWSTLQRVLQPGCLIVVDNAKAGAAPA